MLRALFSLMVVLFSGAFTIAEEPAIEIVEAKYGYIPKDKADAASEKTVDVAAKVKSRLKDGKLRLEVGNALFGDPLPNTGKTLHVKYKLGETEKTVAIVEGEMLLLPEPVLKGELKVKKAAYGDHDTGSVYDVTDDVKVLVNGNVLEVAVNNDVFGDPASGVLKSLRVEYTIGDVELVKSTFEGGTLRIEVPKPVVETPPETK